MRQRKIKDVERKIEDFSPLIIQDPSEQKGNWREAFGGGTPEKVFAEFGTGKGQFIRDMAKLHRSFGYIGFEGHQSVVYHALQKADEAVNETSGDTPLIRFVTSYIDLATDYFEEGELDGIYLNFSDPWPKNKHKKRRLTAGSKLEDYVAAVKSGGSIEFRTDNDGLFDYTMNRVMTLAGVKIIAVSRDLHSEREEIAKRIDASILTEAAFDDEMTDEQDSLPELMVTTEYEDKFSSGGKSINYLRLMVI